nr:MAG TPA: hypothetical protein [Caudoviricetes sp.]
MCRQTNLNFYGDSKHCFEFRAGKWSCRDASLFQVKETKRDGRGRSRGTGEYREGCGYSIGADYTARWPRGET